MLSRSCSFGKNTSHTGQTSSNPASQRPLGSQLVSSDVPQSLHFGASEQLGEVGAKAVEEIRATYVEMTGTLQHAHVDVVEPEFGDALVTLPSGSSLGA